MRRSAGIGARCRNPGLEASPLGIGTNGIRLYTCHYSMAMVTVLDDAPPIAITTGTEFPLWAITEISTLT